MRRSLTPALAALLALVAPSPGGEFDRVEGEALAKLAGSDAAVRRESLSFTDLDALPAALSDARGAFLLVKTDQGNYTRILASPALRKPAEGDGPPAPVLVLERFDTFEPGRSGSRLAKGAGLVLFEGFRVDLDGGIVVPEGQGGDLEFVKAGKDTSRPRLRPVGRAVLMTLSKPIPRAPAGSGPSPGKTVRPADFSGRYTLHADGRFTGLLELTVDDSRAITGRFRSELNGTSYPVAGEVSAESPQKAVFKIKYPRTEQEYDAYLWTEGKDVLAGSFVWQDRTFGFYATREGAKPPPGR